MDEAEAWAILATNLNLRGERKRRADLVSIFDAINCLFSLGHSKADIARRVGISPAMLTQFLAIKDLPPNIVELVKERKLDAVKTIHWLAKVRDSEHQNALAQLIADGNLAGDEVPATVRFLAKRKELGLEEIVNRIVNARKQKIRLILVVVPLTRAAVATLDRIRSHSPEQATDLINKAVQSVAHCNDVVIRGDHVFCLYDEKAYSALKSHIPRDLEPADVVMAAVERTLANARQNLA